MLVRTPPQLPFVIVVEPPTRADIVRLLRRPALWLLLVVLGGFVACGVYFNHTKREFNQANAGHLNVSSSPSGARIKVDGNASGWTPALLAVSPGPHTIRLERTGYGNTLASVSATSGSTDELQFKMWRSAPDLISLRPALPGTKLVNAQFLADGQPAVTVAYPSGLRQMWLVDAEGRPVRSAGPAPSAVASVSPVTERVAIAKGSTRSDGLGIHANEVWTSSAATAEPAQQLFAAPAAASDQEITDLTWTPDDSQLLVVISSGSLTGSRTSLTLLDVTSGSKHALAELPSRVVPGSYSWSPNGASVAFLTQSDDALSLCLLNLPDGQVRYLTDVAGQSSDVIPFPPISWSPDGKQIVYETYDRQHPSTSWFLGSKPQAAIIRANADGTEAHRLGPGQLHYPVWYPDGTPAAWAGAGSGKPMSLRSLSRPDVLVTLSLTNAEFGVRWDTVHDQALIAVRRSSGSSPIDFSLIRFTGGAQ